MPISANWEVRGLNVKITAARDPERGRYYCSEIRVSGTEPGQKLDQDALRSIPIADLVLRTVQTKKAAPSSEPLKFDSRRLGPDTLPEVARVYREALDSGDNQPTTAVATRFGVPRGRAGQWVHLARKKGLLGPTVKGRISA